MRAGNSRKTSLITAGKYVDSLSMSACVANWPSSANSRSCTVGWLARQQTRWASVVDVVSIPAAMKANTLCTTSVTDSLSSPSAASHSTASKHGVVFERLLPWSRYRCTSDPQMAWSSSMARSIARFVAVGSLRYPGIIMRGPCDWMPSKTTCVSSPILARTSASSFNPKAIEQMISRARGPNVVAGRSTTGSSVALASPGGTRLATKRSASVATVGRNAAVEADPNDLAAIRCCRFQTSPETIKRLSPKSRPQIGMLLPMLRFVCWIVTLGDSTNLASSGSVTHLHANLFWWCTPHQTRTRGG
eukprot:m.231803 g.231803  ORF g.231803 m.231803 type:complete len:304 (-) comp26035_c0_seq2:12-923(-)